LSVPDFGQIRRRLEQLGAILETTRYTINLSTQDSETGHYGLYYIASTIDAVIAPDPVAVENSRIGYYPPYAITVYTSTALSEGDVIKDAASDYYTVKTVSPIEFGDDIILYEAKAAGRLYGITCPLGEQLTNGGFEEGDFTGWTTTGAPNIETANSYDGTYYATFERNEAVTQNFTTPIPVKCITIFSFYAGYGLFCNSVDMRATVTYSDATTDTLDFSTSVTWTEYNLLAICDDDKAVASIKIEQLDCAYYGAIDLVSLICSGLSM
jgi:hypothetical protein